MVGQLLLDLHCQRSSEVANAGEEDASSLTDVLSIKPSAPALLDETTWEAQSLESAVTPPTSKSSPYASTELLTWGIAALSLAASRLGPRSGHLED